MDTENLRNLAASYRSRANVAEIGLVRSYESEMASYLESVAAWIEERQGKRAAKSVTPPPDRPGARLPQ